ncbi:MAG: class I SAM-dependent methyltransferase [Nitrospirales bacterium]
MIAIQSYDSGLRRLFKKAILRILPHAVSRRIQDLRAGRAGRPIGHVRFGDLRRLIPFSRHFGYDRGLPIDRYYIENFLARHAGAIQGRVLEIGDAAYTNRFGGARVTISDVLHVAPRRQATIVGDLTQADHIPSDTFDCIILTQTLHLIFDVRRALQTVYRILKPGGVLLATFPGITQIDHGEWAESWYWNFTTRSSRRLFHEVFLPESCDIEAIGNVLVASAFLYGLGVEELHREELDYNDRDYEFLITARAQKPR